MIFDYYRVYPMFNPVIYVHISTLNKVFVHYYLAKCLSLLNSNHLIVKHSIIVIIAIFTTIIVCEK